MSFLVANTSLPAVRGEFRTDRQPKVHLEVVPTYKGKISFRQKRQIIQGQKRHIILEQEERSK